MAVRVQAAKVRRDFKDVEERLLSLATQELILNHGGLFVATAARETRVKDIPVWIISVSLRHPTGHEGHVGELLYDGDRFYFLTEQAVIDERVRQISADPESKRKWNEYRPSTSRSAKA